MYSNTAVHSGARALELSSVQLVCCDPTYGGDDGDGVEQGAGEVPARRAGVVAHAVEALVGGRDEHLPGEVVEQSAGGRRPVPLVENVECRRHRPQLVHVPLTHLQRH